MGTRAKKAKSVNDAEISHFSALADQWWDAGGPMAPLHKLNPARLAYIKSTLASHFGDASPTLLDVGCGAGLVAEPLAQNGFNVTGLDASAELVEAARAHAASTNVAVTYTHGSVEELAAAKKKYNCVLALEILEHVNAPRAFIQNCAKLIKPGGLLILSTLNRTAKSFALGVVAAEYLLRWVPIGTHDWKKFIRPSDLASMVEEAGLSVSDLCGLTYNPLADSFSLNPRDVSLNYFLVAKKNDG